LKIFTDEEWDYLSSKINRGASFLDAKAITIMNKPKYFYEMNSSGKRQLVPESKIRGYMQTKNK